MHYFERKTPFRRILYSMPTVIILCLLAGFFIWVAFSAYSKAFFARAELKRSNDVLAALAAKERNLSDEVEYLKTAEGMEERLRETFGVGREGESLVVFVDRDNKNTPAQVSTSFFDRFKRFFGF